MRPNPWHEVVPALRLLAQVDGAGTSEDRSMLFRDTFQNPVCGRVLRADVTRREGRPDPGKRQGHVGRVRLQIVEETRDPAPSGGWSSRWINPSPSTP